MSDPDRALLEAIARGSEWALANLIDSYKDRLFRYVYRHVRSEEDAAEIVSETFVRVFRYAGGYEPRSQVSTWIYSIATNLCRDHYRRRKRWSFSSLFSFGQNSDSDNDFSHLDVIAADGKSADEQVAADDDYRQLLAAIDNLPEKLKSPFVLHVIEEQSQKECSEILDVSEKTVETRIYRARKLLQKAVLSAAV